MEYFCPYCQERFKEDKLAVSIDPDNSMLKDLAQMLTADAKSKYSNYQKITAVLIEKAQSESSGAGLLCVLPKLKDTGNYDLPVPISAQDVLAALNVAFKTVERAKKRKPNFIDDNDYESAKDFISSLDVNDFEMADIDLTINLNVVDDENGNCVFHEARKEDGELLPKVCGGCYQPMFKYSGEMNEFVIGLLGSERVAKSSCIAASLYGFLLNDQGDNDDVHFSYPEDDLRWEKVVEEPLLSNYRNSRAVEKTQTSVPGASFCITVKVQLPEPKSRAPHGEFILTFIDMPGEYMHDEHGLSNQWFADYKRLFKNADVFWFCIDLIQVCQVVDRDILDRGGYLQTNEQNSEGTPGTENPGTNPPNHVPTPDTEHVVNPAVIKNNLNAIKTAIYGRNNNSFPPTAIILTKSDMALDCGNWPQDGPPSYIFCEDLVLKDGETGIYCEEQHLLQIGAFHHLCKQVRHALHYVGGGVARKSRLINMLEEVFPKRAYFSTSAYSRPVERKTDKPKVNDSPPSPFRTRLPLFWTLAVLDLMDVSVKHIKSPDKPKFSFKKMPAEPVIEKKSVTTEVVDENENRIVILDRLCMCENTQSK